MCVQNVAMNYLAAQRNMPTPVPGRHSRQLYIATASLSTERDLMRIK